MPRLTVTLRPDEYAALQAMAWSERRPTRDQLAFLVANGLAAAMKSEPRQEARPDRQLMLTDGAAKGDAA